MGHEHISRGGAHVSKRSGALGCRLGRIAEQHTQGADTAHLPEREALQRALEKSELCYRTLFEHMTTGVAVYEPVNDGQDFRFVDMNPSAEKSTQTNKNDVIGRLVTEVFPGVAQMGVLDALRRAYRTKEVQCHSTTQYRDKRLTFWAENNVFCLPDGKIVALFEDVTEREKARLEKERVFNLSSELICVAGTDGYFKYVNPAWERTLGYSTDELLAQPVSSFVDDGDFQKGKEITALLSSGQATDCFDVRYRTKNGQTRTISCIAVRLREEKKIYCVGRDVTEIRKAEEDLRYHAGLLEHISDAVISTDADYNIRSWNHAAAVTYGWSVNEAIGNSFFSLIGSTQSESSDAEIIDVLQKNGRWNGEIARCRRDGSSAYVESTITLIYDSAALSSGERKVTGMLSIDRDITERKRMSTQLAQTERLAGMGMLAAGVAHEINNPLTYVMVNLESAAEHVAKIAGAQRGKLQIHKSDTLDALAKETAEALEGAARVCKIVDDLRTFSRAEDISQSCFSLNKIVDGALNMARHQLKFRARVKRHYGTIPKVRADVGKLAQVILNLLINAAHAIEEGDVENNEVVVRTWHDAESICVEIRDTGVGIAAEDIPHVFDPFFTTKAVGVGSGLGLPICQDIVSRYGGTISVKSTLGKGSSFVVRLPLSYLAASDSSASIERQDGPSVIDEDLPRGRVLIIDDEPTICEVIRRMLEKEHDVVVETSAVSARKLLETDRAFDVIICDLMMSESTGMDLVGWLATVDETVANNVVLMTGGAFTPKASAFLEARANPVLKKPFTRDSLRTVVSATMQQNPVWR